MGFSEVDFLHENLVKIKHLVIEISRMLSIDVISLTSFPNKLYHQVLWEYSISPLTSIMIDQCSKYTLRMKFVGGEQNDINAKRKVLKGEVQLVFISPDGTINNPVYRNMLLSHEYKKACCISY